MGVGPIELAPRDLALEPSEKPFVPDVHPDSDLGLPAIASKMTFSGQDPEEVAGVSIG